MGNFLEGKEPESNDFKLEIKNNNNYCSGGCLSIQKADNFYLMEKKPHKNIKSEDYSFYGENAIEFQMKQKFIKDKENLFKEEIKNEIKKEYILHLAEITEKNKEEIINIKKLFKNELIGLKNEYNEKLNEQQNKNNLLVKNMKKGFSETIEKINLKVKEISTKLGTFKEKWQKKNNLNTQIISEAFIKCRSYFQERRKQNDTNIKELLNIIDEKFKNNNKDKEAKISNDEESEKNIDNSENKYEDLEKIEIKLNSLYNEIHNNKKTSNRDEKVEQKIKEYSELKKDLKSCILKQNKKYKNDVSNLLSKKGYGKVGIQNNGNNCYIISLIQILKNIPKFTSYVIRFNKKNDSFLNSMKELFINICSSYNSSYPLNKFKNLLGNENNKFNGNEQYDSTIFYISLLNLIHKKVNSAKKDEYIKYDRENLKNKDLQEKFYQWKKFFISRNKSFIINLFYIFYVNQMKCTSCNNISDTFQSTNFFDFPIVSETKKVKSLQECFENFQKINDVSNKENFNCSNCDRLNLSIQFIILELPPVLMINLKRVGEKQSYYNDIEIPFILDMGTIIKNANINSIYELRGFIKHNGTEKGGHNYAFCKNMFDENWYEYNDSKCYLIKEKPSLDKIFFLCYIKIGSEINSIDCLKEITEYLNK